MGSIDDSSQRRDELTVLVTGFGPFKKEYPVNPSSEIAASLPDHLPPLRPKDPASRSSHPPHPHPPPPHPPSYPDVAAVTTATAANTATTEIIPPPVRILKLPGPVRTSYEVVRDLVPKLWDNNKNDDDDDDPDRQQTGRGVGGVEGEKKMMTIDYAVHIGMAGPQRKYQIERRGHRDGYDKPDVDGRYLGDDGHRRRRRRRAEEEEEQEEGDDDWIWHGVPADLLTDLDVEDVHRRWVEGSPKQKNLDLRISEDAGRYLCDFIYFSSLAHLWRQRRPRRVVFLHVPLHADAESLRLGRELVLQLIRAMVESEVALGRV
ncbi:putative pyroglutamyl peptidase type I [Xylariomycetidae sp. FL2044]|nr:putative pyroglutamyl peptidase type I [Xylariomycetidae sp. FL2044]